MIEALSDISRTNQIRLTQPLEEVAEKLFQYLFRQGKGIEIFSANDLDLSNYQKSQLGFFQNRHRAIKREIKRRLAEYDGGLSNFDIQYFLSETNGKNYVFFLSPNKTHSGWKQLFCEQWGTRNRERILNLIFKIYLLFNQLPAETMNDSEELLLIHSAHSTKSKDALVIWGNSLFLNYNHHNVVTLKLSRKRLVLSQEDPYKVLDGEDMGQVLIYKEKKYFSSDKLDARIKNQIKFIRFDKEDEGFEKFKKTQLFHYQNLKSKLEELLDACGIEYEPLHFQADHYLENSFVKNIESVKELEIINNSGVDLSDSDKAFMANFLKYQGIPVTTFYRQGKTISTYEPIDLDGDDRPYWKITQVTPWEHIKLVKRKNYLVLNKLLDEESGSMGYRQDDGLWNPSAKIDNKQAVDFYSHLKRRHNYLSTGEFFSIQGLNIAEFNAVGETDSTSWSVLEYSNKNIDLSILHEDIRSVVKGQIPSLTNSIYRYIIKQQDTEQVDEFCKKHGIKVSPEFEKVLIEIGIKNWIKDSLSGLDVALPVFSQPFSEKQFFAVYVRRPRDQEAKAVAVEFLYKDARIQIKGVMRDVKEIETRFPILRRRKTGPDQLVDDQEFLIDEAEKLYISCYTNDLYTPLLIGRPDIIQRLENGTLEINRRKENKFLPLVMCYNDEVQQIKNLICLDLKNGSFIQYYVPPAQSLRNVIKNGFRVYHMIGKTYTKEDMPTSKLIKHPLAALHFNTLTQNVLRISENSQSSLLQKVAKVFIEN